MESSIIYGGRCIARRPSLADDYIVHEVFDGIRSELAGVLNWDLRNNVDDWTMLRDAFAKAVWAGSTDGHRIADHIRDRELRGMYWPWEELAEIFDGAPFDRVVAAHVRKWRSYFRLEPTFSMGDTITFRAGWNTRTGTIADIREDVAQYGVRVEGESGKYLVAWEVARSMESPAAAPETASPRP